MPKQLALGICMIFIFWLLVRDRKLRPMPSVALWIPFLWIMIVGSRPVSSWFGKGIKIDNPGDYIKGSPLDRNVFFILIIAGIVVLLSRKVDWNRIFSSNRLFFLFFIYFGVSIIWSYYPYVSLKRWFKDLGNVIAVLIILTEKNPVQAFRAVFARYTYFAVPLSLVFIKYFPDIGRYYNRWTWEFAYSGVAMEKNDLGVITFVCGLFLVWDYIEMWIADFRMMDKVDVLSRFVLIAMMLWLIIYAGSMTSLVCLMLGVFMLFFMRRPIGRKYINRLGTYSIIFLILIVFLYSVPGALELFVDILGREMTFTGRTDLWADLLNEPVDMLVGTGYQSFWQGPVIDSYWQKYSFRPNQAHNGYLETYLNGGLIGVFLLIGLILSTGNRLKKRMLLGGNYEILLFSFFIINIFYNWTEAMFNELSLVWIIMLLAILNYPRSSESIEENTRISTKCA